MMTTNNKKDFSQTVSDANAFNPVSYGKSRVAGSNQKSYFMHQRSACMPGQKERFQVTSRSKNETGQSFLEQKARNAFKREKEAISREPIGRKFYKNNIQLFTYQKFHPYDDESLKIALNASYRQIYGNLQPMESERPIELERRLRNGDYPIREFIRKLAQTPFYKKHYFENISQKQSISLNHIHILGRNLKNHEELLFHIKLLNSESFEAHIDSLIDSFEYQQCFGEDIVPYPKNWNSPCGTTTSSFVQAIRSSKGYASSDNVIQGKNLD